MLRVELELDLANEQARSIKLFQGPEPIGEITFARGTPACDAFLQAARDYPNAHLCWFETTLAENLVSRDQWPRTLRHDLELRYYPLLQKKLDSVASLGLADPLSPFGCTEVPGPVFPGWMVSPFAGVCRTDVIDAVTPWVQERERLTVFLLEFGWRALSAGLCMYSDSRLARDGERPCLSEDQARWAPTLSDLARLTRRTHSRRNRMVWLAGLLLRRRRVPFEALKGFSAGPGKLVDPSALDPFRPKLPARSDLRADVDVVIPTFERPGYLADLLADLARQDLPPSSVQIVDQGRDPDNQARMDALASSEWPFPLFRHRVPWVGVGRARNFGAERTSAPWVLLLDDDLRLPGAYISHLVSVAQAYGVESVLSDIGESRPWELDEPVVRPRVYRYFWSGVALCDRDKYLAAGGFDDKLDGMGTEDHEFGFRMRLQGTHVLLTSGVGAQHLYAQTGGFRAVKAPWVNDKVQPNPSPVILYLLDRHGSADMRSGLQIETILSRMQAQGPHLWPTEFARAKRGWRAAQRWARRIADRQTH